MYEHLLSTLLTYKLLKQTTTKVTWQACDGPQTNEQQKQTHGWTHWYFFFFFSKSFFLKTWKFNSSVAVHFGRKTPIYLLSSPFLCCTSCWRETTYRSQWYLYPHTFSDQSIGAQGEQVSCHTTQNTLSNCHRNHNSWTGAHRPQRLWENNLPDKCNKMHMYCEDISGLRGC